MVWGRGDCKSIVVSRVALHGGIQREKNQSSLMVLLKEVSEVILAGGILPSNDA
jgi:hypothetical protein